ncbi:MAG: DNA recombination protein RmuC [Legionella sp.]|nr:DNA recombination protein RmuC [Legionella sp.]
MINAVLASVIGFVFFAQAALLVWFLRQQLEKRQELLLKELDKLPEFVKDQWHSYQLAWQKTYQISQEQMQEKLSQNQLILQQFISDNIRRHMSDIREQMQHSFAQHASSLTSHLQSLTQEIQAHLNHLTKQVNHRLTEGLEKTSSTFTDVVRRLTIIDEAQKKMAELSTHVISLQDILVDKRSRGAFGEVQLSMLIANMIPPSHYRMQHTLSNQKRADCILFLPEPSGHIVIDSKFPLETFQKLMQGDIHPTVKKTLQQQFRQDLYKHIKDVAEKYIVPPETADSAVIFIPAEAIFAEIHANYPDVIALSQRLKVWLVSPSTLMAVLTTAKAVLKDDATRKQVHVIQQHLHALAGDFQRFEKRMDKLSKHIDQAHQDVGEVNTSAKKITQRFQKIETVELSGQPVEMMALNDE